MSDFIHSSFRHTSVWKTDSTSSRSRRRRARCDDERTHAMTQTHRQRAAAVAVAIAGAPRLRASSNFRHTALPPAVLACCAVPLAFVALPKSATLPPPGAGFASSSPP